MEPPQERTEEFGLFDGEEDTTLRAPIQSLGAMKQILNEIQKRLDDLSESLKDLRGDMQVLMVNHDFEERKDMKYWVGDLLTYVINEVYKRKNEDMPEIIDGERPKTLRRYAEAAARIVEKKWLDDMDGLSGKYYKSLQNFAHYNRGSKWVGLWTQYKFAQSLLTDRYKNSREYRHWSPLFKFAFHKSVEEMAANPKCFWDSCLEEEDDD